MEAAISLQCFAILWCLSFGKQQLHCLPCFSMDGKWESPTVPGRIPQYRSDSFGQWI